MATTIGIFAHVDAGKTTLAEQILFRAGEVRTLGRVDDKSTHLDHDAIERARGITIFADEAPFSINGKDFFLIDTPGHTDFGGEMERSMCAIDCAILVISAVEGIQGHTATVWNLLRKNKIPTAIFINKTDREGANVQALYYDLRKKWGEGVIDFRSPKEDLATINSDLLDSYLAEDDSFEELTRRAILNCEVFPTVFGSALHGKGIDELLQIIATYCYKNYNINGKFSGLTYKVRHEKGTGRITFIKILEGKLCAREVIKTPNGDEKTGELRRVSGSKSLNIKEALAGELVAVSGLSAKPGDILGEGARREARFSLTPLLSARVEYPKDVPSTEMLRILRELEDEEPLYHVSYNSELREIHVQIMGEIQLEILQRVLDERYGIAVTFGECEVVYKETIENEVYGFGHFEPLRHYAEVHLKIEPCKCGGILFESNCAQDKLSLNWQRLIETHVFERTHRGVLVGAPLTDVKITLIAGRAHLKHTEGGDFREATYRAIRQGLMKAKSVLLEPWLKFEVECAPSLSGRILGDVQAFGGKYDAPMAKGEFMSVSGSAPAKEMMKYAKELVSISGGRARINLCFDEYYPSKRQDEIVAARAYNPERDLENTPDSVFCAKGAGFPVKWNEAEAMMNIPLPKK